MKVSCVRLPPIISRAARLTDDPRQIATLALDCAYRFLLDNPADLSLIDEEPPVGSLVILLGTAPHPVDWVVHSPSGGLGSHPLSWSASAAGLHGQTAVECQALIDEGIEQETAAKLLRKYGTLPATIDNLSSIRPKKHWPLLVEAQEALVSQTRSEPRETWGSTEEYPETSLRLTLPSGPLQRVWEASDAAFAPLREEILRRNEAASTRNYVCVRTTQQLWDMVDELATFPWIAVDTETSGLDQMYLEPVGVSISAEPGRSFYIPVGHETGEVQLNERFVGAALQDLLLFKPLIMHNAAFDVRVLAKLLQVHWREILRNVRMDTMLAAFVTGMGTGDDRGTLSLDSLSQRLLGIGKSQPITDLIGTVKRTQIPFSRVPLRSASPYGCRDSDITGRIFPILDKLVDERGVRPILEMEMDFLSTTIEMEKAGCQIDLSKVGEIDNSLSDSLAEIEKEIYRLVGPVNLDSPTALSTLLYDELQLPPGKKTETGYSTERLHLETIATRHPVVLLIMDYREMAKLKSTYVDNLQEQIHPISGRVHVSWKQAGTATGRLSSSGGETSTLNFQNQPKRGERGSEIRKAFVAPLGKLLVGGDLGQAELRVMAHVSGDPNMIADFLSGLDFHTRTAARMFGVAEAEVSEDMRSSAKNSNFSIQYRVSAEGFAVRYRVSVAEAKELIKIYYEAYPRVREWQEETIRFARQHGYVETLFGRKRWFPDLSSAEERAAINLPIQACVADIVKLGMNKIDSWLCEKGWQDDVTPILQVHDEVIYEAPTAIAPELLSPLQETFESIVTLKVPLVFEPAIGIRWSDLKAH